MKTTIDISDALFIEAKRRAAMSGITLRALIEQSLRQTLKSVHGSTEFQPRDARVKGKGLTAAARASGWRAVLDAANER